MAQLHIASIGENTVPDGLFGFGSQGTLSQVTTSDFSTGSVSLVDVPGLTFSALPNKVYEIEAVLRCRSSDTGGEAIGINFSAAGATVTWVGVATANGIAIPGCIGSTTLNSHGGSFGGTSTKDSIAAINGYLTTGANAGNITLQALKQSGGTLTVYIGSRMVVTQVG